VEKAYLDREGGQLERGLGERGKRGRRMGGGVIGGVVGGGVQMLARAVLGLDGASTDGDLCGP